MAARRHLAGGIIVARSRNKPTAVGFFENTSRVSFSVGYRMGYIS